MLYKIDIKNIKELVQNLIDANALLEDTNGIHKVTPDVYMPERKALIEGWTKWIQEKTGELPPYRRPNVID